MKDEMQQQINKLYEETYSDFVIPEINLSTPRIIDTQLANAVRQMYAQTRDKDEITYDENGNPIVDFNGKPVLGQEEDRWIAIVGYNGKGKSTLASGIILEWCKIAGLNISELAKTNIAFDEDDILRFFWSNFLVNLDSNYFKKFGVENYMQMKKKTGMLKHQYLWADEGANVFFNRDSMGKGRTTGIKFVNAMRVMRCLVVVCAVELSQLDTIIKEQRVKTIIRIQEQGIYQYYGKDQIDRLFADWDRRRDRDINWKIEPLFGGRFSYNPEIKRVVDAVKYQSLLRTGVQALALSMRLKNKRIRMIEEILMDNDEKSEGDAENVEETEQHSKPALDEKS